MDPVNLVARYSFITNKLRYCGPEDSFVRFLEYIKNPDPKLAEEIKSYIKRFEGLYPYLELIAKKTKLDIFDPKVIEAYWIGNSLLDIFDENDLKDMIMALSKRGLPKSYAKKLVKGIPKGMKPHHSFNVIYVGVGKVTGSVEFNIENINNCLIRPAEIIQKYQDSVIVKHKPYVYEKNKLLLSMEVEEEYDYQSEFNDLEIGDTVSVHWKFVVDKLDDKQLVQLMKYTHMNVEALNNGQ